jgi:hypothetical protein
LQRVSDVNTAPKIVKRREIKENLQLKNIKRMEENKKKELRRLCSMTESLFYGCDQLMGKMEIDNGHGFDVSDEDEPAFIAIGELHELADEYRFKLKEILDKLK